MEPGIFGELKELVGNSYIAVFYNDQAGNLSLVTVCR